MLKTHIQPAQAMNNIMNRVGIGETAEDRADRECIQNLETEALDQDKMVTKVRCGSACPAPCTRRHVPDVSVVVAAGVVRRVHRPCRNGLPHALASDASLVSRTVTRVSLADGGVPACKPPACHGAH